MADKSAIVISYDEQSAAFKDIQARSPEKDSGCQHGTSFLVFERSTAQFYELFLGSKSFRPEAKKIFPYLPLTQADLERKTAAGCDVEGLEPHGPIPVTIKTKFIENAKGSWYVPVAVKCSVPFTKVPATAVFAKEITRFLSAKSGGVEKVAEPAKTRAR